MLYISGIELPMEENEKTAIAAALTRCGLRTSYEKAWIYKRAVDARKKQIKFSYTVAVDTPDEERIAQKLTRKGIHFKRASAYDPDRAFGDPAGKNRPVVVGFGPAGAFAALMLAERGFKPLVLERGGDVEERRARVDTFNKTGELDPETNIQFGEGGAGTFSDGKLFTRVGDPRCDYVLGRMAEFAELHEIARLAHPHVGTDKLFGMMKAIRARIESLGGEIRFHHTLTGLESREGRVTAVLTDRGRFDTDRVILACGHSARDTFFALAPILSMEPKGFAMGVRVEHLREDIDKAMYGDYAGHPKLGSAEYRLISKEYNMFSFCMCPGGTVVAAASEAGGVVTNGMSEYARSGRNSNAALVMPVSVTGGDALAGITLQRELEQAAFRAGGGDYSAPVQTLGDFAEGRVTTKFGRVTPTYPAGTRGANLGSFLPGDMKRALLGAMTEFGRKIKGYDAADALFAAPETRTSSPVRITRGEDMMSVSLLGVYPCGEGAGYAGGILSAAVDGIKAAERSSL